MDCHEIYIETSQGKILHLAPGAPHPHTRLVWPAAAYLSAADGGCVDIQYYRPPGSPLLLMLLDGHGAAGWQLHWKVPEGMLLSIGLHGAAVGGRGRLTAAHYAARCPQHGTVLSLRMATERTAVFVVAMADRALRTLEGYYGRQLYHLRQSGGMGPSPLSTDMMEVLAFVAKAMTAAEPSPFSIEMGMLHIIGLVLGAQDPRPQADPAEAALREGIFQVAQLLREEPDSFPGNGALARRAGTNKGKFKQRFAELMGQPPYTYWLWHRMATGVELLRNPQHSLTDIAYTLGFSGLPGFTKAFKRLYGVSPSEYRREARNNE